MNERYIRNMNMISAREMERLSGCKVCIVGCGGLGGYVIEMLGRLGVGSLTVVDGDVFDESNLNRQLLSEEPLIGHPKAMAAVRRMAAVNSGIHVIPHQVFLTSENCDEIIKGHDAVIDALDRTEPRRLLESRCSAMDIPLVHGAIGGWYAQISTIMPGDDFFSKIYPKDAGSGIESDLGNPSFTPALAASIQVSEVIKILLGKGSLLRGKLLTIDLLENEYDLFDL